MINAFKHLTSAQEVFMKQYLSRERKSENILTKYNNILAEYIDLFNSLEVSNDEKLSLLTSEMEKATSNERASTDPSLKFFYREKQRVIALLTRCIQQQNQSSLEEISNQLSEEYLLSAIPSSVEFTTKFSEDHILRKINSLLHGVDFRSSNRNRNSELIAAIVSGKISQKEAIELRALLEAIAHGITNVSPETSYSLCMPRYLLELAASATSGNHIALAQLYKDENFSISAFKTLQSQNPEENE